MIQIEIGIAIEIEKKWGVGMQTGCLATCGQWSSAPWETGNRLAPFCQPVISIYIVDFDPDFDKLELHAIALSGQTTTLDFCDNSV
ncbi:hypothetical protein [Desulfosarcina ovata]|uniref:Uncharacterized protein n=1 Tax=Desulfosarcina ovata subsp. ovata TaxID=2752305 RepID=A0A5K8AFY3_9BACT|nr:hypothetical protein [Desulfosarcina ovata]BBO91448.1 hypothetical protein DSCOOX_46280 [Desulfosarcina ovata subsp. ovata]